MRPDESTFRDHFAAGPFQVGVDRGDWRLVGDIEWPNAMIAVAAGPRDGAPKEFVLRFELTNYPQSAPTSQPWSLALNAPLPDELWPAGGRASEVFNPNWNRSALYIPCDRQAVLGHDPWLAQHQAYLWRPDRDITFYLRIVRDVLRDPDYLGTRSQAA